LLRRFRRIKTSLVDIDFEDNSSFYSFDFDRMVCNYLDVKATWNEEVDVELQNWARIDLTDFERIPIGRLRSFETMYPNITVWEVNDVARANVKFRAEGPVC
jgi:hypothetical protein